MIHALFMDENSKCLFIQSDLKTEKGYINRVKKYKGEHLKVKKIHFYKTHDGLIPPYYKPDSKSYKIVEI